jgi:hypothetical protein
MTAGRPPGSLPPSRVPTLTEELRVPPLAELLHPPRLTEVLPPDSTRIDPPRFDLPAQATVPAATAASAEHDAALAQRLLADMQQHLDRVLDTRIAAAVEPLLEQLSARLLDEAREQLASSLREAMAVALARELSRHRGEPGPR